MRFFKKIKKWLDDQLTETEANLFLEVFIPKGPTLSATEQITKYGLPFHIEWKGDGVRNDN